MKFLRTVSALILVCAGLVIGADTAVVGEEIFLSPAYASNPLGAPHTVTARVQDSGGFPIANRQITFRVVSGPNANLRVTSNTNSSGQASFTYTSSIPGIDSIEACFTNPEKLQACSNQVTKAWIDVGPCPPGTCCVCHRGTTTLSFACSSLELQRHLDHGDPVGACTVNR